jgi:hypothetical protein
MEIVSHMIEWSILRVQRDMLGLLKEPFGFQGKRDELFCLE